MMHMPHGTMSTEAAHADTHDDGKAIVQRDMTISTLRSPIAMSRYTLPDADTLFCVWGGEASPCPDALIAAIPMNDRDT